MTDPEERLARVEFYAGTSLPGADPKSPYSITWSSMPAGTYALKATAYDADGASAFTNLVTITVNAASSIPSDVVFQASADHSTTKLTSYQFEVFANGADPKTATPLTSSDLGKPTPASNGDITVDRSSFFSALVPGS